MRLSKRLAMGILAAMMALSMSACKPSEQPPASSSTGNQPSTSTPSASSGENNGSASSSGSSSSASSSVSNVPSTSGSESKDADLLVETRTEKFFSGKNIINSARWTYTAHEKRWIDGKLIEGTRIAASDGWRTYTAFKDYEGVSDEEDINDPSWSVEYRIFSDGDGMIIENNMTSDSMPGILTYDYCYHNENMASQLKLLRKICKIGTYTIDGTEYYSETYGGHSQNGDLYIDTFCFDKSDTEGKYLRYRICQTKNSKEDSNLIIKVTGISNTFDESLLRIPEGYRLYRDDPDTGKFVLVTESTPKDNYPN